MEIAPVEERILQKLLKILQMVANGEQFNFYSEILRKHLNNYPHLLTTGNQYYTKVND